MSTDTQKRKKVANDVIIRMNSVGLPLSQIAEEVGLHSTTVTLRLHELGITPADTRRSFMSDIYNSLPQDQKDWLHDQVGPAISIKDFMKDLLVRQFVRDTEPRTA